LKKKKIQQTITLLENISPNGKNSTPKKKPVAWEILNQAMRVFLSIF
jgi:hypothetical protein